jgi:hypothetical protein
MTRFETMGRIVEQLRSLDDASLEKLLAELPGDLTDETIDAITYGRDDTEHLRSSPVNAEDLKQAVKELEGYRLLTPQRAP